MLFNQIGHNDVCNHTCPRTFLRDLGVDKSTDVSAKVHFNVTHPLVRFPNPLAVGNLTTHRHNMLTNIFLFFRLNIIDLPMNHLVIERLNTFIEIQRSEKEKLKCHK